MVNKMQPRPRSVEWSCLNEMLDTLRVFQLLSGALCSLACTQVRVLPLASQLSLLVALLAIHCLYSGALFPFVHAWLIDVFEFQELVFVKH